MYLRLFIYFHGAWICTLITPLISSVGRRCHRLRNVLLLLLWFFETRNGRSAIHVGFCLNGLGWNSRNGLGVLMEWEEMMQNESRVKTSVGVLRHWCRTCGCTTSVIESIKASRNCRNSFPVGVLIKSTNEMSGAVRKSEAVGGGWRAGGGGKTSDDGWRWVALGCR